MDFRKWALEQFVQGHHLAADRPNTYPHVTKYWISRMEDTRIIVSYYVDNGQTAEERGAIYFKDDFDKIAK